MALAHSPSITRTGLRLWLDAANTKSYPGSGTTWTDLTGNGNNCTLNSSPTFSSSNGGSIALNGSSQSITVPSIARTTAVTISAWLRTNSVTSNTGIRQYIYTQQQNPPNIAPFTYQQRQGIMIAGNVFQSQWLNTSNADSSQTATTVLVANTWYNVTWTLNGTDTRLYINGVLDSSATTTAAQATAVNDGKIGRRGDAQGDDWFNGNIASVIEYNRALTADEVRNNFEALRGRFGI